MMFTLASLQWSYEIEVLKSAPESMHTYIIRVRSLASQSSF